MRDIIFHIGHPKCASTTLQNKVFINEPGYLGIGKTMPNNLAKELQRLAPVAPSISWRKSEARRWGKKVSDVAKQNWPETERLIASSEMYSNNNKLKERPIIPFLKYFAEHIWTEGEVKVIMVIRNQSDKIASNYAQVSRTNIKASQNDFEKYVYKYIKKNDKYMDYALWVKDLHHSFGKKNVCILLMEDIKTEKFWQDLNSFCDLKNFNIQTMLSNDANSNSKKLSKNSWKLQEYDPSEKARIQVNNYLGLLWPHSIATGLRLPVSSRIKNVLCKFYANKSLNLNRGNEIMLTDTLKLELWNHYKKSNIELEKLLNRDLSKLNYY
jgi:hypothetical protein